MKEEIATREKELEMTIQNLQAVVSSNSLIRGRCKTSLLTMTIKLKIVISRIPRRSLRVLISIH
jgi:uncharacterized protein YqhQ